MRQLLATSGITHRVLSVMNQSWSTIHRFRDMCNNVESIPVYAHELSLEILRHTELKARASVTRPPLARIDFNVNERAQPVNYTEKTAKEAVMKRVRERDGPTRSKLIELFNQPDLKRIRLDMRLPHKPLSYGLRPSKEGDSYKRKMLHRCMLCKKRTNVFCNICQQPLCDEVSVDNRKVPCFWRCHHSQTLVDASQAAQSSQGPDSSKGHTSPRDNTGLTTATSAICNAWSSFRWSRA